LNSYSPSPKASSLALSCGYQRREQRSQPAHRGHPAAARTLSELHTGLVGSSTALGGTSGSDSKRLRFVTTIRSRAATSTPSSAAMPTIATPGAHTVGSNLHPLPEATGNDETGTAVVCCNDGLGRLLHEYYQGRRLAGSTTALATRGIKETAHCLGCRAHFLPVYGWTKDFSPGINVLRCG
jgi:hypothetical protein